MADLQEVVSLAERETAATESLPALYTQPQGRLALSLDDLRSISRLAASAAAAPSLLPTLEQVLQDAARGLAGRRSVPHDRGRELRSELCDSSRTKGELGSW